jgi:hypothetical protein
VRTTFFIALVLVRNVVSFIFLNHTRNVDFFTDFTRDVSPLVELWKLRTRWKDVSCPFIPWRRVRFCLHQVSITLSPSTAVWTLIRFRRSDPREEVATRPAVEAA